MRSQQQGSRTDLVCVMKCYLAGLTLPSRPIGHLMQVITLVDFALGLFIRFKEDDTLNDLRLVIDNFAAALSLCPLEHPGVPSSWNTPVLSFRASSFAEMQSMQYFCYCAFSNTVILRVPPSLSACTTDHDNSSILSVLLLSATSILVYRCIFAATFFTNLCPMMCLVNTCFIYFYSTCVKYARDLVRIAHRRLGENFTRP